MALEQYKSTARLTDGISLDLVSSKERIRSSQSLESRLDQISQLTYKEIVSEAEKQGALYGVTKRPTMQQISDSVRKGEDPSTLFIEGGTVFGDAARESQAEMLRQDLEFELTNQFSDLKAAVKAGLFVDDPNAFAADMQAQINGYASTLSKISPIQTKKFLAGMNLEANKTYTESLKVYTDRINGERQFQINKQVDHFTRDWLDVFRESDYNWIDTEALMTKRLVMVKDLIEMHPLNQLENKELLDNMTQNMYTSALLEFAKNKSNTFVPENSTILAEIDKGNFGALSLVYNDLDQETKDKFKKTFIDSYNADKSIIQAEQQRLEAVNQKKIKDINLKVAKNEISGRDAVNELFNMGIYPSREEIKAYLVPASETDATKANAIQLKYNILAGKAGRDTLKNAWMNRNITTTEYQQLENEYANTLQKLGPGVNRIKTGLGIPEFSDLNDIPSDLKRQFNQLSYQLSEKAYAAFLDGTAFDQQAEAQKLLLQNKDNERQLAIDSAIKTINDSAEGKLQPITISNYQTLYNKDDKVMKENLRKAGIEKVNNINRIVTQIKYLQQTLGD
jgi:hypothetical protein